MMLMFLIINKKNKTIYSIIKLENHKIKYSNNNPIIGYKNGNNDLINQKITSKKIAIKTLMVI